LLYQPNESIPQKMISQYLHHCNNSFNARQTNNVNLQHFNQLSDTFNYLQKDSELRACLYWYCSWNYSMLHHWTQARRL